MNKAPFLLIFVALGWTLTTRDGNAADRSVSSWGPFKLGMSAKQLTDLAGGAKPVADQADSEITEIAIERVRLDNLIGTMKARVYKDKVFAFDYSVLNAADQMAAARSLKVPDENKINWFCPSVFVRSLNMLAASYGKPDDIVRPGEITQADNGAMKLSVANWWFSDGSRITLTLTMRITGSPQCVHYIGIQTAQYAKPFIPEIMPK